MRSVLSRLFAVGTVTAVVSGVAPLALAGALTGSYVVNTYLPGNQNLTSMAASANGDTMLLWTDAGRGSASFMRRYGALGQPLTVDEVNVGNRAGYVVADRVGNYAVSHIASDGSGDGVFVTVYDRAGNVRVNSFRVNDVTAGNQIGGNLAMDGNGNFAVAWMSYENNRWVTYAKQYAANGAARSPAIQLNAYSADMYPMGMVLDSAGNLTVSGWQILGGAPDVWMRRLSSTGALLGGQTTVNTYTSGVQTGGSVAINASNNTIVVWQSYAQDGSGWSVYGQRFNPDGSRLGTPFRISQTLADSEPTAQVGMAEDGSFVVTWYVDNRAITPGSIPSVYARQFYANATPVAAESMVSSLSGSSAFHPQIGMTPAGNYTIGWRSYASGNLYDVGARRYALDTLPPTTTLSNGQTVAGLGGAAGSWQYFLVNVPAGTKTLNITMSGPASGDGDLYIRFGGYPSLSKWDIRPYLAGNNESVSISNPPAGAFYIGIYGYSAYSSVSLKVSHN